MKLFYRKLGNGPVLIILHGLFGSSDNWLTIAKALSENFTVILPDQRNHGQSPHSSIHDYESMSKDLHELVTDLSIDRFFLAGHSMGGKTAIDYAIRWPETLVGLLVADISPFRGSDKVGAQDSYHAMILETILGIDLSSVSSRDEAENELNRKGLTPMISAFILKNLKRISGNKFEWKLNAKVLLENLDKIMKPMDRDLIYSHRVSGFPVIFLRGIESDYLPPEDYADISGIFPAAEFIDIPGAGHWLHADNPDEVIKSIKRLLS